MRILMICYRYPPDIGGVERAASALSGELARTGHAVTVITGADAGAPGRTTEDGVEVIRFPLIRSGGRYTASVLSAARRVAKPDVIHAHIASAPAVAAAVLGLRWRVPVVVKPSSG